MKVKTQTHTQLIIENKSISWLGVVGCLSILGALSYKIVLSIQEQNFSPFFLLVFVVLAVFLVFGLAISFSVEFCYLDKPSQEITIISQTFSIKKVTVIAWSSIVNIEVAKTNTSEEDVGSVRYEINACLTSGKKIELGHSDSEKRSKNIAEQVRKFLSI